MTMLFVLTACATTPHPEPMHEAAIAQETEPKPELNYPNNTETTSVRFYYHCYVIDPYANLLPEAFLYNEVAIPTDNLFEEFIKLMYENVGVRILDLWFSGDKLYVNLHEDAFAFFNGFGTTGGSIRMRVFENSLLSLPQIASFEVLIDGQRGVEADHFNFSHVAIVEDGQVIRRDFFTEYDFHQ